MTGKVEVERFKEWRKTGIQLKSEEKCKVELRPMKQKLFISFLQNTVELWIAVAIKKR